jgi:hypothetical protein
VTVYGLLVGTSAGPLAAVVAVAVLDAAEEPTALNAMTRNEYAVLAVNPVAA